MHSSLLLVTLLLLNLNSKTSQTRISELETCMKHLEKVVTVVRNLVKSVDDIKPESYAVAKPTNCADLLNWGNTESGVYTIHPKSWNGTLNDKLSVYCHMETDGGGWIVFQRRADYVPRQNFYQDWETYKRGFGQIDKEFWLGNENIYVLTNQENVTLRVDLEDFEGESHNATYDNFNVSNCQQKYTFLIGKYSGNAGDSLTYHANTPFATFDDDNTARNCTAAAKGGWWYDSCHNANLNGLYKRGPSDHWNVVSWGSIKGHKYSLKKSEMKIRPSDFKKPM